MDLLLSKRVDGTFNDSLSYLDYKKQKPNAKIKAIKKVMLNKVDLHLHFLKKQMMKQFKNSMMA